MDARILPLDFVYLSVVVTVQKILIHGLTQMKHGKMQTTRNQPIQLSPTMIQSVFHLCQSVAKNLLSKTSG